MVLECNVCRSPCSHQICFILSPCHHVACVKCFHQAVPASYALQCPCSDCQIWVESSALFELTGSINPEGKDPPFCDNDNVSSKMVPVQDVIHFEPDEQMDPFRHWTMKKPDLFTGFLYVAFRCNNDEASFYKTNFKAANSTVFLDDDSSDDLIKIFARVLHPLLFRKDFFHDHPEVSTSEYRAPSPVHEDRQNLALTSLYALSSGKIMSQEEQAKISRGSISRHTHVKRKAIECAKGLAKELLLSKRNNVHVSNPPTDDQTKRKLRKRRAVLSPVLENQGRGNIALPARSEKECLDFAEAQVPYMLGFLLLGAAWMISN